MLQRVLNPTSIRLALGALFVYPVKALRGIPLQRARVNVCGIELDRHWMLVDRNSRVVTQIEQPRMALIDVAIERDSLRIDAAGMSSLHVPLDAPPTATRDVRLFRRPRVGLPVSAAADRWFAEVLGIPCSLVRMPPDETVTFANQRPFHLVTTASCDDLSSRAGVHVPFGRFRPNFVVTGAEAYEEDAWLSLKIGAVAFDFVEQPVRCAVTTVDPATGTRGIEPLRTLSQYRASTTLLGRRVHFGQYFALAGEGGEVAVGEEVRVVATTPR
jgi:uncharacterized protein YcbX